MRAVIVATGDNTLLRPLTYHLPSGLTRVLDKPMLEHMIEHLQPFGVQNYEIILHHKPEMIEELLGEGKRWGVHITYHLARESDKPFDCITPLIESWSEEYVLLGSSDILPDIPNLFTSTTYYTDKKKEWTGWAYLQKNELFSCSFKNSCPSKQCEILASAKTLKHLQQSNLKAITSKELEPPGTAKKLKKGLWVSRASSIDPTAKLIPPVFIGENCQVGSMAIIGPNAVIENHSVVGGGSEIKNSLICQRSFVGEGLFIQESIVDRSKLINTSLKSQITIPDSFILGDLRPARFKRSVLRFLSFLTAANLFLLFLPLITYLYFTRKIKRERILKIPTSQDKILWKTCALYVFRDTDHYNETSLSRRFLHRLPLLINVMKGDLHFTGLYPRTPEEVENLHPDWRRIYLSAQAGIITLADVELDEEADPQEIFATEAYYCLRQGFFFELQLCLRWLWRILLRKINR